MGCIAILHRSTTVRTTFFNGVHVNQPCYRDSSTLLAVVLDAMGLYCEGSWGVGWAHLYVRLLSQQLRLSDLIYPPQLSTATAVSVTIAMYCLLQVYVVVKPVVDNPDAWLGSADIGRREARNDKGGWLQNDKRLLVKICAIKGVGVFIFVVLVLHLKTDLSINGQYLLHFGKRRCCR